MPLDHSGLDDVVALNSNSGDFAFDVGRRKNFLRVEKDVNASAPPPPPKVNSSCS